MPLLSFPDLLPDGLARQTSTLTPGRYVLWCALEGHEALGHAHHARRRVAQASLVGHGRRAPAGLASARDGAAARLHRGARVLVLAARHAARRRGPRPRGRGPRPRRGGGRCSPRPGSPCARQPLPSRDQRRRLALVSLGVVLGFPLLTSIALRDLPAAHAAVIVGILPAATAVAAVVRAGERPSRGFWAAGVAGLVAALGFAAAQGAGTPQAGRPAAARGRRPLRAGLRGGRRARTRPRRGADDLLGARALAAGHRGGHRARGRHGRRRAQRRAGRVARLRLRGPGEHVPRLLRLVRGAGARRRGEDRPGPALPGAAHAGLVGAPPGRGGGRAHPARGGGRAGLRGAHPAQPRGRTWPAPRPGNATVGTCC